MSISQTTPEILIADGRFTIALDYDANGNMIFRGKAPIGTLKTTKLWQITKFIYDTSNNLTDIQWADSDSNFYNVWNDRVSLNYG